MKILVSTSTFAAVDLGPLDLLKNLGMEVVLNPFGRKLTKAEIIALLMPDVCGLVAGLETLDEEVLKASSLKVISRVGAGISNIDLDAARRLGIKVFSTPDAPTSAVAELTLGAMLWLLRSISLMDRELHEDRWQKILGAQLEGKTVAVIGYGRIGRRVAELVKAFGAHVICVDPAVRADAGCAKVLPLDRALAVADIITIHVSGEQEIIGPKEFALMKKGVLVLNAARGGVVNEGLLMKALDEKKVIGAWLDTFFEEPYQGPLVKYPQVLLTPHVGSFTAECRKRMEMEAIENLLCGLREAGIHG
ncbi:MAG: NAD(P)-dependent oxidoreductase [Candidatus Omnitrophota bacterium]|nr:NAD(P)-dependent oxidoreductase [Candidatus Omnitrophota bacterium]